MVGQMVERAPWAVPTGERSGMLVLDVDAGEGTDEGTDSVALLELSCGQPPKTSCAATGGGGVHLYFRYPSPRELRAAGLYTRQVRNSQGLLGDGLDVRGIWAATSWPHRAARCEPTGGSIGRLPPVPPGYSGV
ncbi:MAG TPA: bifunctional DNA primase/polymerase [Rubrobacteraceae bacterium]|nr:bifunctional DNA primase/polymerase [Rubrobacteraceae bacterium]